MIATFEICEIVRCYPNSYGAGAVLVLDNATGQMGAGREYVNIDATPDMLRKLAAELARVADAIDAKEAAKCKQAA